MKNFLKRYSYQSVVLFLNQIAIALFGLVLSLAAGMAENEVLKIVTGIFSVVFFLFLQYGTAWRAGSEDHVSINLGKIKRDMTVPLRMWLLSNSLNLLLAVFITLGFVFSSVGFFSSLGGISATVALLVEGMYTGILSLDLFGAPLNSYFVTYFIITLPSLATVMLGYATGSHNFTLTGIFTSRPTDAGRKK